VSHGQLLRQFLTLLQLVLLSLHLSVRSSDRLRQLSLTTREEIVLSPLLVRLAVLVSRPCCDCLA